MHRLVCITLSVGAFACAGSSSSSSPAPVLPTIEVVDPSVAGPKPESWVQPQVVEAHARMKAAEGGRLLHKAIDAHGGLGPWLSHGTLSFDFDYVVLDKPEQRRYSKNRIDIWSRKAVQEELGEGADARLGWNGTTAWMVPNDKAFPSSARFWATTPFYFVGLPWVLADPGVNVQVLEPVVLGATGVDTPLPTLKASFDSGVGDAPDDYYILHLHPETHRILAVRYVVTFGKSADAKRELREKVLLWSHLREVQGLWVAHHYDSHPWIDGAPGPRVTQVEVDHVKFGQPIPAADFDPPK